MNDFEKRNGGFVVFRPMDGGTISAQTVEANLMFAILEKLTEISETNKQILAEASDINSEFPPS